MAKGKFKKYWLIWLVLGFLVLLLILKLTGTIQGNKGIKVAIEEAKSRSIYETVTASGKVYSVEEVSISSDVSGEVIQLYVQEGQYVQAGELLAKIDARIYSSMLERAGTTVNQSQASAKSAQAQIKQAEASFESAKAEYQRFQKLIEGKIVSQSEFEKVKSTYESAQANLTSVQMSSAANHYAIHGAQTNLKEAKDNLSKTLIRAPRSGTITLLNIKQGERVVGTAQMAGTEIMRISNLERMEVRVSIGENDIIKVKVGDTAQIELDAFPDKKIKGRVTRISNSNGASGALQSAVNTEQAASYQVYIELDAWSLNKIVAESGTANIRPNMSARAKIFTRVHPNVISIPISSVTTRSDDSSGNDIKFECVFILDKSNKHIKLHRVTTNLQDDNYIEINSGVKSGDKIIAAPYSAISKTLKDKSQVEVVKKEELQIEE